MADDPRVQQLLDELLDSARTPEEVCGECPELLSVVRNRWRQMRRLRADLDALFPHSDDRTQPHSDGTALPRIPGYEIEAVLGRGGMGIVFRARHLRLNRPVAIKTVLEGGYAGPRERERFQREAEAVAALRHPNVVQVYDSGEAAGRPYFTMELVEGGSLAQKLAGTPQPTGPAVELVATLAGAMQAAHQGGIVHRDLKPANVLLTGDGTPKISDFGLARRLEGGTGLTQSGVAVGTPSYMAPEQARGQTHAVRPAVDVYALGAILYELLTGRPPFRAATSAETIQQVISQEPAPPSRLNDKVPRDLETICLKCLRKEPDRRYASAAALADDLRRFEEGRPILARPVGRAEKAWRWAWRKPTAAALLATALTLVGLAVGSGMSALRRQAERDAELHSQVGTAVTQAVSLRKRFQFREARDFLDQIENRIGPEGPDDLRRQVRQGRADLELAEGIDDGQARRVITAPTTEFDFAANDRHRASVFAKAGFQLEQDAGEALAAAVRDSALRSEIVGALDEWASITPDRTRRAWLCAVARAADPHPARDRLRQPDLWLDKDRLAQVVREVPVAELSPQLAITINRACQPRDRVPLLTAAQAQFPEDFWLNAELAWRLREANRHDEAVGYFRAAVAVRPDSPAARHWLGISLQSKGELDQAISEFRYALRLEPKFAGAHVSLAHSLSDRGRMAEALDHFRQYHELLPESAEAAATLGLGFLGVGRREDAIKAFEEAIRLDPKLGMAHNSLALSLRNLGRHDEAIDRYQQALRLDPNSSVFRIGHCMASYVAARADAQAAAGEGRKNGPPTEAERAALRRKALERLRVSLNYAASFERDGTVINFIPVHWQSDPSLASVRDPAALAKLPAAEREQWQRYWADVAAVVAASPLERGRFHAARRERAQSAGDYVKAAARGHGDESTFWFEYAAVSYLSSNHPGYAKACAYLVERCGKPDGPRAYLVARTCTLAPDAVADASLPGRLAEKELKKATHQFWALTERGALAYRSGRFKEAVPLFEQSLKADPMPGKAVVNWLWLALANQQLGKTDEARRWLEKSQAWLDQYRDGMPPRAEQELGLHLHNSGWRRTSFAARRKPS